MTILRACSGKQSWSVANVFGEGITKVMKVHKFHQELSSALLWLGQSVLQQPYSTIPALDKPLSNYQWNFQA